MVFTKKMWLERVARAAAALEEAAESVAAGDKSSSSKLHNAEMEISRLEHKHPRIRFRRSPKNVARGRVFKHLAAARKALPDVELRRTDDVSTPLASKPVARGTKQPKTVYLRPSEVMPAFAGVVARRAVADAPARLALKPAIRPKRDVEPMKWPVVLGKRRHRHIGPSPLRDDWPAEWGIFNDYTPEAIAKQKEILASFTDSYQQRTLAYVHLQTLHRIALMAQRLMCNE